MRNRWHLGSISFGLATLLLSLACARASELTRPAAVLAGIPQPMTWQNPPQQWSIDDRETLSITAGRKSDWFASPMGDSRTNSSPRLLFKPAGDFVLSAKVTVSFQSQWDAGVLVLYENDSLWAKLCFENTIEKRAAIVSVVTKNVSDDNNSIEMSGPSVYLKIAKAGPAIFFYASQDGHNWKIIRSFSLGETRNLRVGFSSQAPVGDICTSVFSDIQYAAKKVDLWQGK
jgi:uncharacterized protein